MSFEVFTDTGSKNADFISITRSKSFGVSRPFLDNNKITDDYNAVLLHDKTNKKIAIAFTTKQPKYSYSLRLTGDKRHGGAIFAKSFFDREKLDVDRLAGRYSYSKVPLNKLIDTSSDVDAYVIDLAELEAEDMGGDEYSADSREGNRGAMDLPF